MFSIIIPLYNKAPYVAKAIQSVAAQTYQEFELIVIDDGSTDIAAPQPPKGGVGISYDEIEMLIGNKGYLVKKTNEGVSTTRNKGVKLAKYDYIAFLDADDWWEPTFLEEMKALIDEYPDAGIYASSYYIAKNNTKRLARIGVETDFKSGYIEYFKVYAKTMEMPVWTGAVIIPKNIYNELQGFKPELKLGEDFHLWVRIADRYKVAFVNKQLSNYNQDVDVTNRAVGEKLYQPYQHMLFTEYKQLTHNSEFIVLFESLAVYGLMPYYLAQKNKTEVKRILATIHWQNHAFKYQLQYRILPRVLVKWWYKGLKWGVKIKKAFFRINNGIK